MWGWLTIAVLTCPISTFGYFWDMSTTWPKGLTQSPTDDIDICLGIVNRLVRPEGHNQSDLTNGDFTFEKRHGI